MPRTSESSTERSKLQRKRSWKLKKRRAARKARFNEVAFTDTFGEPITNNWHHLEWFDLTESYDRLLIEAAREHAKTEIFAKGLPLFEIGVDRNIRILIVSATFDQAAQRTRVLKEHIERNGAYRGIFPADPVEIASRRADEQFTVKRDRILKEPTVLSTYAGGPIPGYRFDIVILDDLVSFLSNSTTAAKRERLHRWVADEVLNAVAKGGKVWVIGTRQHHDDEYERLKQDARFHSVTYPAWDEEDVLGYRIKNEDLGIEGEDASCLWPFMHDFDSLMAKRAANPDSFERQQQQVALPETGLVYRRELVDAALERGKAVRPDKYALQELALDPGYAKRASLLAIQTRSGDRVELWGEYSFTQMSPDEVSRVVVDHCRDWNVQTVYMDAEDAGLAGTITRDLQNAGLEVEVVRVPFGKYKRLSIGAIRWLFQTNTLTLKGETTTVYRPGGVRVEKSILRREIRDYALDPNREGEALKDEDHGPDALAAWAIKWIDAWLSATEKSHEQEKPVDRALQRS